MGIFESVTLGIGNWHTWNDLITNLSHDLRTPLTSILGYMGLIANIQYTDEESLHWYKSSNTFEIRCRI
ncbi:hypothetical protein K2181_22380 [Clostridium estertheticum]|nr:hypothetical protein [Clostridium estertheticum]WLC82324.1 hypothetical protein KTC98_22785 [Clostridium estertheticum]